MGIETKIEKALTEPSVIDKIQSSVQNKELSLFLVCVKGNGYIDAGEVVEFKSYEPTPDYKDLDSFKIMEKHESGIDSLEEDIFTLTQFTLVLKSFREKFGEIKPDDVPILTFWRKEVISLEKELILRKYRMDASFLNRTLYRIQYLMLNELRREYKDHLLINGQLISQEPDFVNLLIVQQTKYLPRRENLLLWSKLDAITNFVDRIQPSVSESEMVSKTINITSQLYKKSTALLDLSNKKIVYE